MLNRENRGHNQPNILSIFGNAINDLWAGPLSCKQSIHLTSFPRRFSTVFPCNIVTTISNMHLFQEIEQNYPIFVTEN